MTHDTISLNKVKKPVSVSLPGYIAYNSNVSNSNSNVRGSVDRWETVLLMKNYVSKFSKKIDTKRDDQIWIQCQFASLHFNRSVKISKNTNSVIFFIHYQWVNIRYFIQKVIKMTIWRSIDTHKQIFLIYNCSPNTYGFDKWFRNS